MNGIIVCLSFERQVQLLFITTVTNPQHGMVNEPEINILASCSTRRDVETTLRSIEAIHSQFSVDKLLLTPREAPK